MLATAGALSEGSTSPGRPKVSARLLSAWHAFRSRALILFGNFHTCSRVLISQDLASKHLYHLGYTGGRRAWPEPTYANAAHVANGAS